PVARAWFCIFPVFPFQYQWFAQRRAVGSRPPQLQRECAILRAVANFCRSPYRQKVARRKWLRALNPRIAETASQVLAARANCWKNASIPPVAARTRPEITSSDFYDGCSNKNV